MLHQVGSGGMATVYLADDTKLERRVAIKVLKPALAAVLGGERFLREVKITARLEHPHILGLYDSGEAGGFLFYVMPFVEGESLRDRLDREKQLPIEDALQITREVADALSYAHSHDVIHRDVKPENILLQSGHAVVADFGIARAITAAGGDRLTETGVAVGTPSYMSPEQAAGEKDLDGRSDLYSLACVLYEMLAGQPPFTGPTAESVIRQHLTAEAQSITNVRPAVPSEIAGALGRALAKTPADRFNPVALFGEAIAPRGGAIPSGTQPVPQIGLRRWLLPGAVTAAAVLMGMVVVLWRVAASGPIRITTSNLVHVTSEPGVELQPSISPDGREVVYVENAGESPHVVVRSTLDIGSGGETRPAQEVDGIHSFPTWTPDGASLRFRSCVTGSQTDCGWKEVGKLGGAVRPVSVPRSSDRYVWSRDGTRGAFAVADSIFAYSAEGGEPELLGIHPNARWAAHSFAWSPDGRRIAYVDGNPMWRQGANVMAASIWMLNAAGGTPVRVTDDGYMNLSPQWLPDGRHLLFVSNRDGARGVYVVEVGPNGPRGAPQTVLGASDAHSISISADGRRLAYSRFPATRNVFAIQIPPSGVVSIREAVPVTARNRIIEQLDLSPDGEWIVFDSDIRGEFDIYKQPVAGGPPQLVADIAGNAFGPDWSPLGTEIAFTGYGGVYVVPAEGGVPARIVDLPGTVAASDWSPDGLTIAFMGGGSPGAKTVARDSVGAPWGEPTRLTDFRCVMPDWAPDGTRLACIGGERGSSELLQVSTGGEVLFRHPMPGGPANVWYPKFSPDGSRIYFTADQEDGSRGVWWIPSNGGNPKKVVAFDDPSLHHVGFPAVGSEKIYLTGARLEGDIWVMDLEW